MNKAQTLKRRLGNPKLFLSVAWDTEDIPSQVSINPNLKWKDINWKKVEKSVFRLQKLIYRASMSGEIRKMHRYQKLLLKSYYARLLAVRRVTQDNQGKKTAGIDGIKNISPMQRFNLVNLLASRHIKASPTRRVYIPKPGKDEKRVLMDEVSSECKTHSRQRPLGIPTMYDRALQALVKLGMEPEWEALFEPNSYGLFRRSAQDAIGAIFDSIHKKPKYVLDADISKCFDRINHDALLGKVSQSPYRRLIKQWLKSGVMDNNQFHPPLWLPSREGMGWVHHREGSSVPKRANIALHGMEERLNEFAKTIDMKRGNGCQVSWQNKVQSLNLIRYESRLCYPT
ncbi:reverse transcriptase N-terminal domain-containing protein [Okeania sp. KiyG1]|uniref:reverse transcriptase N-terminal domain-containing protein n=1 Tax=Okeania sp. KiyG1 TaxID=2720165 RepID=UPI001998B875|nr:reverse transcriptase N-terminal domain-containing protein [Okeania sp. KiyG1]GGA39391.1 hypothetical protein CYANOKiyG1_57630 [Okeania sp. KiyG1]